MTVKPLKEIQYSYNKFRKGLLFLIFYALFNSLQTGIQMSLNEEMDVSFVFSQLAYFILWLPVYSLFLIMLGIVQPDVRVTDTGLFVQVFFFWWVFVPWENVQEIRIRFKKSILHKEATVVLVRRLTPFHWLIGILVRKLKPAFQIDHSISGYDELVDLIQRRTEQNSKHG